jgi:sterol desaturase/sphingolipid hydroxylase (fatty acid hydroxylase superfamily)
MKEFIYYLIYYDFCYYFLHRLLHTKYFYFIHKIHHKKISPNYYDYYTINLIEIPFTSLGLFIAIYLYKLYIYQLLATLLVINIRGVLTHDERFIYLMGDHHLKHHKYFKSNYGEYWMDYIFGTTYNNNIIK